MEKEKNKEDKFNIKLVNKFGEEDLYDDCPICQAMKAAKKEGRELSLSELQELFKKASGEQELKS